jgi:hypothetical protein
VQFMFKYVAGLRGMAIPKDANTTSGGYILANDMGYVDHLVRVAFVGIFSLLNDPFLHFRN